MSSILCDGIYNASESVRIAQAGIGPSNGTVLATDPWTAGGTPALAEHSS